MPGILVQLGIFGALFVGFGLIAEYRAGVIETQRVTPAPRTALLMGRVMRDVVVLSVQAILLTVVALPLGLRAPVGGVLIGLAVVALLGAAFSAVSYAVALTLKSEDALAPLLNAVAMPVLLLSGILLPMTLAPGWLEKLVGRQPAQARGGRRAGVLPRRLLRRHGVVGARRDRGPCPAGFLVRDADVPARVSLGAAAPSPA